MIKRFRTGGSPAYPFGTYAADKDCRRPQLHGKGRRPHYIADGTIFGERRSGTSQLKDDSPTAGRQPEPEHDRGDEETLKRLRDPSSRPKQGLQPTMGIRPDGFSFQSMVGMGEIQ